MTRNILITGATGKQGRALIRALLSTPTNSPDQDQYHIYAQTRTPASPSAQSLLTTYSPHVMLVAGDLNDVSSMTAIFESVKLNDESGQGIWGIYAVLPFPGLGASAEPEERQGKMMADLAVRYEVQCFVYSSAMRAGPRYEDKWEFKPSGRAKREVEEYIRGLGEKEGLPWIIMRPGFFMENFDEFIGSVAFAIMKKGLKEDTDLALIASDDIGNVAAGVFRDHQRYLHQAFVLAAEYATMDQIADSYKRATGKPIPAIPGPFAWMLVKMNKAIQDLIEDMELNHHARASGDYPELNGEVALANSAYKMKTYYEWVKLKQESKEAKSGNWNQVSLGKLLTGKM